MEAVDDRLGRKMPYCVFLHHCTMELNANLLHIHQNKNKDGVLRTERDVGSYLEQMKFPAPVQEYFATSGETTTASSETVAKTQPPVAIPLPTGANLAGRFNGITPANHNVYECYVAPRVTWRRIEAQLENNYNWTPLAPELMPDLVATSNFLGYGELENLSQDARALHANLYFPPDDENSIEGRLQYCPQIVGIMNHVIDQISAKYKTAAGIPQRRKISGLVGFV